VAGRRTSLVAILLLLIATAARAEDSRAALEAIRAAGDLAAERTHGWSLVTKVAPQWEFWPTQEEAFETGARTAALSGARVPYRPFHSSSKVDAKAAVWAYELYNPPAFAHIRDNRLYSRDALDVLNEKGAEIPPFPQDAIVIKSIWRPSASCVAYCVAVDAAKIAEDPMLAAIARRILGRDLQAGDKAELVGLHIATKEIDDWVWASLYWDGGGTDADVPADVPAPYRSYRLTVAFDDTLPKEPDGSAHIAFNPHLEGPFPNGAVSNCMSCHVRAAWPEDWATDDPLKRLFLPIRRGPPDKAHDPSFASGHLRTDFIWAIPDRAW